jgi:hypothetical protein
MTDDDRSLSSALARVRRRASLLVTDRWLAAIGGVLMPLGVLLVILGWYGAAHTTRLFEEIPYLISGGLFGLVLVIVGGAAFFGTWLARMLANQREVLGVLLRIEERLDQPRPAVEGEAVVAAPLVATRTGSMYHRPDCPVVAGRAADDLRPVLVGQDGLTACRICAAPA